MGLRFDGRRYAASAMRRHGAGVQWRVHSTSFVHIVRRWGDLHLLRNSMNNVYAIAGGA